MNLVFHNSDGSSEIELKHYTSSKTSVKSSRKYFVRLNWTRLATNPSWVDSSTGKAQLETTNFSLFSAAVKLLFSLLILCFCWVPFRLNLLYHSFLHINFIITSLQDRVLEIDQSPIGTLWSHAVAWLWGIYGGSSWWYRWSFGDKLRTWISFD